MSEPRWRDADLRPPDRGVPGSYPRSHAQRSGERGESRPRPSPPGRTSARWGALPGRSGVCIVIAGAALGAAVTVLSGTEPGLVLGLFLVAATVAATLAVRPRAVYLVIPVPALAYTAAAAIAGLIHDRAADTSGTGLALSATRWIASGFVAMAAATILAIAITIARRPRSSRGRRGPRSPGSAVRQPPARNSIDRAPPPADRSR